MSGSLQPTQLETPRPKKPRARGAKATSAAEAAGGAARPKSRSLFQELFVVASYRNLVQMNRYNLVPLLQFSDASLNCK